MKTILKIIIIALLLSSCKTRTLIKNEIERQRVQDTIFIEKIQAIHDSIFIKIPEIQTLVPECDKLCKKELTRVLSLIKTQKNSEQTQTGIYYDAFQNQLVLYNKLSPQFNSYRSHYEQEKSIKEVVIEKEKPYIPKYVKVLAIIGAISLLFIVFLLVFKIKIMFFSKNTNVW